MVNGIAQGCGSLSWSWYLRGGEYGDRLASSSEEQDGCLDLRRKDSNSNVTVGDDLASSGGEQGGGLGVDVVYEPGDDRRRC